jgi:hypothetical protein
MKPTFREPSRSSSSGIWHQKRQFHRHLTRLIAWEDFTEDRISVKDSRFVMRSDVCNSIAMCIRRDTTQTTPAGTSPVQILARGSAILIEVLCGFLSPSKKTLKNGHYRFPKVHIYNHIAVTILSVIYADKHCAPHGGEVPVFVSLSLFQASCAVFRTYSWGNNLLDCTTWASAWKMNTDHKEWMIDGFKAKPTAPPVSGCQHNKQT